MLYISNNLVRVTNGHHRFHFGNREIPLSLIVVGALAVGAIFGILASLGVIFKLKAQASVLRKKVKSLEKDATHITTTPAEL